MKVYWKGKGIDFVWFLYFLGFFWSVEFGYVGWYFSSYFGLCGKYEDGIYVFGCWSRNKDGVWVLDGIRYYVSFGLLFLGVFLY